MPNQNHGNVRQLLVSTRHDVESFASCCEKNRAGEGFKLGELPTIPCIGLLELHSDPALDKDFRRPGE